MLMTFIMTVFNLYPQQLIKLRGFVDHLMP